MTTPLPLSAPVAVAPGTAPTVGRASLWTPGTPWRPLTIEQYGALRNHANTRAEMALCDQRDAQDEADGLACPVCPAPIGTRCFGPDARSNHPARAIAHWDARVSARNAA